jgi:hypothetical protein
MQNRGFGTVLNVFVVLYSLYALMKFAFFFVLRYPTRRKALDRAYAGRSYATSRADIVLLVTAAIMSFGLLMKGADPISFLGGLLVGGTLIQLYFHAFHAPVASDYEAPEPRSPLKIMSYAIQAEPARPWKELCLFAALIIVCLVLHWQK